MAVAGELALFRYDSVDSTNAQARRLLAQDVIPETAVVIAAAQTAGRGTGGRSWCSPRGAGLYLSVIQRRPGAGRLTTDYTRAAGVACAEVLRANYRLPVRLKPINDLFVRGRKIGGILAEALVVGDVLEALVTGVGLNLRPARRRLPDGSAFPHTSLADELEDVPSAPDDEELARRLAVRIVTWNKRVGAAGGDRVLAEAWRRFCLNQADSADD